MKNNIIKYWQVGVAGVSALAGVLLSSFAHAATYQPPAAPTSLPQFEAVLCNVMAYFFWIVIIISVIMVLFAAFTYATARDNQEKTSRARNTLTYAAIGIIVALLAYGFPQVISGFVTTANGFSFQCQTG